MTQFDSHGMGPAMDFMRSPVMERLDIDTRSLPLHWQLSGIAATQPSAAFQPHDPAKFFEIGSVTLGPLTGIGVATRVANVRVGNCKYVYWVRGVCELCNPTKTVAQISSERIAVPNPGLPPAGVHNRQIVFTHQLLPFITSASAVFSGFRSIHVNSMQDPTPSSVEPAGVFRIERLVIFNANLQFPPAQGMELLESPISLRWGYIGQFNNILRDYARISTPDKTQYRPQTSTGLAIHTQVLKANLVGIFPNTDNDLPRVMDIKIPTQHVP